MNKIFNKVRKNRALALLLVFAMMLSILPLNTVQAETAAMKPAPVVTLQSDGSSYTVNTDNSDIVCTVSYESTGSWDAFVFGVSGHDVRYYDKVEIKLTPSRDAMHLQFQDQDSWLRDWTAESAEAGQVIPIELSKNMTELKFFMDSVTTYSGSAVTATIESITFIESENPPTEEEVVDPNAVPVVTGITKTDGTTDVTATVKETEEEVLAAVSYHGGASWGPNFTVGVENHTAKYSKIVIDFTPSWDKMVLGIRDDAGTKYRDHWSPSAAVTSGERQTVTIDVARDITALKFNLDPNNATITEDVTFVIHSIKFIDPSAPVEPEKPAVVDVEATLKWESGAAADDQGRLYVDADGTRFRGMIEFPETFTNVEVGKVLTINYDTNMSFSKLGEFAYNSSGNVNGKESPLTETIASGVVSLEIPITQAHADFFNNAASASDLSSVRFRLKADNVPAGNYFKLVSVTYGDPVSADDDDDDNNDNESDGIVGTIDTSSQHYQFTNKDDGSVEISYEAQSGWGTFNINLNKATTEDCKKLVIDITAVENMNIGVWDKTVKTHYRCHWGNQGLVATGGRQYIEVNTEAGLDGFTIYFDAKDESTITGPQTVTIHNIFVVADDWVAPDPNAPEEIAVTLKWEGSKPLDDQGRLYVDADGTKFRGMIEFPTDFTKVEVGKVLTINYETNVDLAAQFAYNNSGKINGTDSTINESIEANTTSLVVPITQKLVDFFKAENATDMDTVRIRLKADAVPAGKYFKLISVTYGNVVGPQYDANQVPQGVAVTYYDDIYSRGVAWNTDNTVPEGALYYVEKTGEMTADTVDWTSDDVEVVEVTNPKAFEDYQGKVWHTFKALAEDLTPGAKYFFRVGHEDYGWSDVGSFTIEKASNEIDSLHFIHLTDTQEEQLASFKDYAKVVKSAYSLMPNAAFMAHTGDQVNNGEKLSFNEKDPSKNVNDIRMQEWMDVLNAPKANLMNSVLMPTVGNHDCGQFVFTDRFNIDWADYQKDDDTDLKTGGCYSFTYGEPENGVLIISLNTNQLWTSAFDTYQRKWLENTLEQYKNYKWKIVQMHAGAITGGGHTNDGESKYLRKTIMPLFSKYKVDLVLQGHDHVYTRSTSMAYGVDPFETTDATKPVYFDGHTPVYLNALKQERVVNGVKRDVYIEPQGTHYITINASGGKRYAELDPSVLDPIIVEAEGINPLNPTDEDGKYGSMTKLDKPTFALVSIEGDLLVYDIYTYDKATDTSTMYDTFAVDKSSIRGYDPNKPHEGKTEVGLYGIKLNMEQEDGVYTKEYDGVPVKLDIYGFNCELPTIMDCSEFKYTLTVKSGGANYKFNPGNLVYGHLPKEIGEYTLKIELPRSNRYYWGEVEIDFEITAPAN